LLRAGGSERHPHRAEGPSKAVIAGIIVRKY
jgi:hypothetical protein